RELLLPGQDLETGALALRHEVALDAITDAIDGIGVVAVDGEPAGAATLEYNTVAGGLRRFIARHPDGLPGAVGGPLDGDVDGGVGRRWRPNQQAALNPADVVAELDVVAAEEVARIDRDDR